MDSDSVSLLEGAQTVRRRHLPRRAPSTWIAAREKFCLTAHLRCPCRLRRCGEDFVGAKPLALNQRHQVSTGWIIWACARSMTESLANCSPAIAQFRLENAVNAADYAAARREGWEVDLNPDEIRHTLPRF